jgi:hypothetical protein
MSFLLSSSSSLSWPWSRCLRSPWFAPCPGHPLRPWPVLAPVVPVVPAVVVFIVLIVLAVPVALVLVLLGVVVLMPVVPWSWRRLVFWSLSPLSRSWQWLSSWSSWSTVAVVAVSPSSWLWVPFLSSPLSALSRFSSVSPGPVPFVPLPLPS